MSIANDTKSLLAHFPSYGQLNSLSLTLNVEQEFSILSKLVFQGANCFVSQLMASSNTASRFGGRHYRITPVARVCRDLPYVTRSTAPTLNGFWQERPAAVGLILEAAVNSFSRNLKIEVVEEATSHEPFCHLL